MTAAVGAAALAARSGAAEPSAGLAAAFEKIPARDPQEIEDTCKALLSAGPGVIVELVGLVGQKFGDPSGVKAKYTLHGLVVYAARPKAEDDRRMVATTLADQLGEGHSGELKAFIVRQLQWCGGKEVIAALGALLADKRLCEPATQALTAIGGEAATAALRAALAKVEGKRRLTILMALGRLRDGRASAMARRAFAEKDRQIHMAALYALANMGDEGAVDLLLKAAEVKAPFDRSQATDACLLLSRRLAQRGRPQDAERLCRGLLAARKAPEDVHARCGALHDLAGAIGVKAVGDVMAAMDSKDLKYSVPAARTALKLARSIVKDHAPEATKLLKKVLESTQEESVRQGAELLLATIGK